MSRHTEDDSTGHLIDSHEPLSLREWTAQDFANIYVRFYPAVLRQAKKFLSNHSQAEEVTQDAFLYLMTSLPEVDSEIGVLRLLKWKTRLLALDVIKVTGGVLYAPLHEQPEIPSGEQELTVQLERADDAAIVALALAKLDPRQREALVASLYEEKTTLEVSTQLGITENATKQLVFRARASFRKALVGEAEINGLSVSGILSVAARKAARESGKYVAVASALVLFFVMPWSFPPTAEDGQTRIAAGTQDVLSPSVPLSPPLESAESWQDAYREMLPVSPVDRALVVVDKETKANEAQYMETPPAIPSEGGAQLANALAPSEAEFDASIRLASLAPYLELYVPQAEIVVEGTDFFPNSQMVLKIHSGVGLWAYVDIDAESFNVNGVGFEVMVDGSRYFGSARSFGVATSKSAFGYTLTYSATELFLIDADGNVFSEHELANSYVTISIEVNDFGEPLAANLFVNS